MPPPKTVNIRKRISPGWGEQTSRGAEIIIARAGRPVARLDPLTPTPRPRHAGLLKGRIRIAANFDAPLPANILDAFEGR